MRLKILPKLFGILLSLGFFGMSYWQWGRHLEKQEYIKIIETRISEKPIKALPEKWDPVELEYRFALVSGDYDFDREFTIKNRRFEDRSGVLVITPLKLKDTDKFILINRGFIPLQLSSKNDRKAFRKTDTGLQLILIKKSSPRRFLAPKDPDPGIELPWIDSFLRIDIPNLNKQIPYELLPVYGELISKDPKLISLSEIVTSDSERAEILSLSNRRLVLSGNDINPEEFPVPMFDTVVPPARHLGYVYEWAFIAICTLLITFYLPGRRK